MFSATYIVPLLATLSLITAAPAPIEEAQALKTFTIDSNGTLHYFDPRVITPPDNECRSWYSLVGNGSPTQWTYNKQVTNTVSDCQGVTCSTTQTNGQTYSWGISLSLSPVPAGLTPDGLSGSGGSAGFDWSESYTSSQSEGCSTDSADSVCLWYSQGYTGTTVLESWTGTCGDPYPQPTQMTLYAPNNNNAGGLGYYCVVNTCRSMGQGYWQQ